MMRFKFIKSTLVLGIFFLSGLDTTFSKKSHFFTTFFQKKISCR